jgi:hypothetical protein
MNSVAPETVALDPGMFVFETTDCRDQRITKYLFIIPQFRLTDKSGGNVKIDELATLIPSVLFHNPSLHHDPH